MRTLRKAFRTIDTGGEGYITFQELEDVLAKNGHSSEEIKDILMRSTTRTTSGSRTRVFSRRCWMVSRISRRTRCSMPSTVLIVTILDLFPLKIAICWEAVLSPIPSATDDRRRGLQENGVIDYEEFKQMMLGSRRA